MNAILDACVVIAFFKAEPGGELVSSFLFSETTNCIIHAVNVCEVYYDFYRSQGQSGAEAIIQELLGLGVVIRSDLDTAFWQQVGRYKATLRRISLADCFALALTQKLDGQLLTADHAEFDPVANLGICPITFIR